MTDTVPTGEHTGSGILSAHANADADELFSLFEEWNRERGIRFYPAQEEALIEVFTGQHVILSTPTGTGKSLVAIGAHLAALSRGERTYYTAPLKALVTEKFFDLVDTFGPESVGMMTGDSSVNPGAAIICCTAEILANVALRSGADADIGQVVMDEFHFYAEPDRGWAWQVPLLTLPRTQFVLMSATLGDVTDIEQDLTRRTGRQTAVVSGAERPVPLDYHYTTELIHDTIDELLTDGRSPVYIVHFSQSQAMERAQALTSTKLVDKDHKSRIAGAIGEFRFTTAFGRTLSRYLRAGIGVHHAGMLPKYRRLVEQLTQEGLLPVICGTDTLGVGINVPIRTVLLTGLTKYDGSRMRQLTAREFHQVAGRAGRAGYDTEGTVLVQAPEHESLNMKALRKAGDDPKKRRKVMRKKIPPGFVSWGRGSFERLVAAEPEPLQSRMTITSAMLISLIQRGGDVFENARSLVFDNHEPVHRRYSLARRALSIYRTLRDAGIVENVDGAIRLTVDLPDNFALDQPLSPFSLAAFDLFDPASPEFSLDIISVVEATLDDPRQVLKQQENVARGEAIAHMKADGVEYAERMERLEEISWPRPLEEVLTQAYERFASAQPWVRDFDLRPKSVLRDMHERAMSFAQYVNTYQLGRSEGVLLRYLSDAYRTLERTVPSAIRTEELTDIMAWLGQVIRQVDSSLIDEWTGRIRPGSVTLTDAAPSEPSELDCLTANTRSFTVMIRNELFRHVLAISRFDLDALSRDGDSAGLTRSNWAEALESYFDEHEEVLTGPAARGPHLFHIDKQAETWKIRQALEDPEGHHDWVITAVADLAESNRLGVPSIRVTGFGRL